MTGRSNWKCKEPREGRGWVLLEWKGGQPGQNSESAADSGVAEGCHEASLRGREFPSPQGMPK